MRQRPIRGGSDGRRPPQVPSTASRKRPSQTDAAGRHATAGKAEHQPGRKAAPVRTKGRSRPDEGGAGRSFRRAYDFSVRSCFPRQFRTAEVRGVSRSLQGILPAGEDEAGAYISVLPAKRATSHARRARAAAGTGLRQTMTEAAAERKMKEEAAARTKKRKTTRQA